MDKETMEDIQDIVRFKHAWIRQKNAEELKQKWKEFLKRQELKIEQGKHSVRQP